MLNGQNGGLRLTDVIESAGGFDSFIETSLPALLNGDEQNGFKPYVQPEEFSMQEILEAVNTTQFDILMGNLLSSKVMGAYDNTPGILDELVTPFNSNLELDKIPGGFLENKIADVGEGMPYPHSADIKDKYVTAGHQKRGEILDITDETLKFDRTGIVMREAARMGEAMKNDREKLGLNRIQDLTAAKAWYPSGSQAAMYAAAGAAPHVYANTHTTSLANYTSLDTANNLFGIMKDDAGEAISITPTTLLVPNALAAISHRLINSSGLPALGGTTTTVGTNEENMWKNRVKVLVSTHLQAASAVDWYLGDFKRQFIEKIVIPIEVMSRRDKLNDAAWERDIMAQYKIRRDSTVWAVDYRYVVWGNV